MLAFGVYEHLFIVNIDQYFISMAYYDHLTIGILFEQKMQILGMQFLYPSLIYIHPYSHALSNS